MFSTEAWTYDTGLVGKRLILHIGLRAIYMDAASYVIKKTEKILVTTDWEKSVSTYMLASSSGNFSYFVISVDSLLGIKVETILKLMTS